MERRRTARSDGAGHILQRYCSTTDVDTALRHRTATFMWQAATIPTRPAPPPAASASTRCSSPLSVARSLRLARPRSLCVWRDRAQIAVCFICGGCATVHSAIKKKMTDHLTDHLSAASSLPLNPPFVGLSHPLCVALLRSSSLPDTPPSFAFFFPSPQPPIFDPFCLCAVCSQSLNPVLPHLPHI